MDPVGRLMEGLPILPTVNATLNAIVVGLLIGAWVRIRRGDRVGHKRLMLMALGTSIVFLMSYLWHHLSTTVLTRYPGEGWDKTLYFMILVTHIPLAALVPPACIVAVRAAVQGRLEKHRRIVRWLYPVWLYTATTGVLIWFMLYVVAGAGRG